MPLMTVADRVLITAVGEYFGQTTMTSWLYRVSSVAGNIQDTDLFNALHTIVTGGTGLLTKFRACCPADSIWLGRAAWYQVLGPTRYRKVQKTLEDGAFDGASNAPNLQATISRFGEFGNRKNLGGIRVPMPTTQGIEGLVHADYKLSLQILATQMEQVITAGTPSVTLIPQVGVPGYTNAEPPVQRPVTDSVDLDTTLVQDTVRVLRRRTLRVGI